LQLQMRSEAMVALSAARIAEWQRQLEASASTLMKQLPSGRPVDIVEEFARPWCLATAVAVTGADAGDAARLASLARQVSLATADPADALLRSGALVANAELEQSFANNLPSVGGPAFVALSQTLPCFLANAWLALARHPVEAARLRVDPSLMPKAMEELLRYAGVARKVSRRAIAPVNLGHISIAQGTGVILMLASANRDPERFPEPDRLDLTRCVAGQVALGAGAHSCVAAALIRIAGGVATRAFIERLAEFEASQAVEWRGGSGFRWAASLYVRLR
jgi:cytochrome P450